jgi:hypothetical protein
MIKSTGSNIKRATEKLKTTRLKKSQVRVTCYSCSSSSFIFRIFHILTGKIHNTSPGCTTTPVNRSSRLNDPMSVLSHSPLAAE